MEQLTLIFVTALRAIWEFPVGAFNEKSSNQLMIYLNKSSLNKAARHVS
jgi:hypothetical protein